MSLLRASFPGPGDFSPLFRLLDDYDVHRSARNQPAAQSFSPRFDVHETDDAYHLDGELPGISQKDIDIEFSDHQTLVVKGHTEHEHRTSDPQESAQDSEETETKPTRRFWATERSVGEFQRSFSFPARVDQDNVKASLKDGILSVTVPKATAAATKKITIE
jgi:HSP20 family molecular chaperone IbpA